MDRYGVAARSDRCIPVAVEGRPQLVEEEGEFGAAQLLVGVDATAVIGSISIRFDGGIDVPGGIAGSTGDDGVDDRS